MNERSLLALKAAAWQDGQIRPLYHSYCYANIPATVLRLFGGMGDALPADCFEEGPYNAVVVFLIDAFGWVFFEKYVDKYPFLKRFLDEGIVSKITSQFPSTTAPHVTCLHTGLEVGQSGTYEWFHYEPSVDRIIAPLLFSYAEDKEPGTLSRSVKKAGLIYPEDTIYRALGSLGIPSTVFQHASIAGSHYSRVVTGGANVVPYTDLRQGLESLAKSVKNKGYFYFYFGDIDAQGHRHGTESKEVEEAVDKCFCALEEVFWKNLDGEVAVILTADHGMIDVDPKKTFYLNEKIPQISALVRKNRKGELLTPAGSCRDYFFHAAEGKEGETQELLQECLGNLAHVYTTKDLAEDGFFGRHPPSQRFWDRVGDLVILPRPGESVWWHEKGRFEMKFHAMHGGLTPQEMETVFLFVSAP